MLLKKFILLPVIVSCLHGQVANTFDVSVPQGVNVRFPYTELGVANPTETELNLLGGAVSFSGYEYATSKDGRFVRCA